MLVKVPSTRYRSVENPACQRFSLSVSGTTQDMGTSRLGSTVHFFNRACHLSTTESSPLRVLPRQEPGSRNSRAPLVLAPTLLWQKAKYPKSLPVRPKSGLRSVGHRSAQRLRTCRAPTPERLLYHWRVTLPGPQCMNGGWIGLHSGPAWTESRFQPINLTLRIASSADHDSFLGKLDSDKEL